MHILPKKFRTKTYMNHYNDNFACESILQYPKIRKYSHHFATRKIRKTTNNRTHVVHIRARYKIKNKGYP